MMFRCAKSYRATAVFALLMVRGVWGGETTVFVLPIGTGPNGELIAGAVIDGDTITLTTDPVNPVPVFFEFRIGDWDPADIGVKLAGYQIRFDSSSLTSGLAGELTFNVGSTPCGECSDNIAPCFSVQDCTPGACNVSGTPCHTTFDDCPSGEICLSAATCGPTENGNAVCEAELGTGSLCGPAGYFLGSGTCGAAYIDTSRPDYVLADAGASFPALDVQSPDVRPGGVVVSNPPDDPEPFPVEGLYAATLALLVPPDARGTFTISLVPFPQTDLLNSTQQSITPLTVLPAKIRLNPGRCCFNLQAAPRCVDDVTEDECAERFGVTFFEPGGICNDPCPPVCGDNVVNLSGEECDGSDDAACLGICLDDCTCNPLCGDVDADSNTDMLGVAIFMSCFTGLDGGPVTSECECAKFDTDDDIDLDDFLGFFNTLSGP